MNSQASIEERDRLRVRRRLERERLGSGDLWALREDSELLSRAVPVLLELLSEVESPHMKIDLLRVASSGSIPPGPLVAELRRLREAIACDYEPADSFTELSGKDFLAALDRIQSQSTGAASLGWDLASALEKSADSSVYDELVGIVKDEKFGRARQMLPYALQKVPARREETIQLLLELVDDKTITVQVIDVLGKLKAVEAIPAIRRYLGSAVPAVRRCARRALRELKKVQDGGAGGGSKTAAPFKEEAPDPEGLVEASTNFDVEQVSSFLRRVAYLVEGFGESDVARIDLRLLEMDAGEEETFDFSVRYRNEETRLQVRIYMSDVGAVDVGFFSCPRLVEAVEQLIDDLE